MPDWLGMGNYPDKIQAMQSALEAAGVEFIDRRAGREAQSEEQAEMTPAQCQPPVGCLIGHRESLRKLQGFHFQPWSS